MNPVAEMPMRNHRMQSACRGIAAIALALLSVTALAQALPPQLDLRLHGLDRPGDDVATPGEYTADTETSVHGSFTTGIGYSKTYGNSTVNAAELDVRKQTGDGRALDLHIGIEHATGLPYAAPPDYVRRYPER